MEAVNFESLGPESFGRQSLAANWHLLPMYSLGLHLPFSADRQEIEHFIYRRFYYQYGARISAYLPYLLSARDDKGISAALGFQPVGDKPLFLEQYLDCDIETSIMLLTQNYISRDKIVEIGNLASGRQRATQTLFLLLAQVLYGEGYEWVVFTANRAVQVWLKRLDMPTFIIKEADPKRLPDKGDNWGSYYDDRPVVLAANIEHSFSRMNVHPLMSYLQDSYKSQIDLFRAQLSK